MSPLEIKAYVSNAITCDLNEACIELKQSNCLDVKSLEMHVVHHDTK